MVTISNDNIITINRGDSFEFPLFINMGTLLNPIRYSIKNNPNSVVYFGVMEPNQCFENALIRQMYQGGENNNQYTEQGDLIIKLKPKDTMYIKPGKYYYQAILTDDSEFLKGQTTIISETPFYII